MHRSRAALGFALFSLCLTVAVAAVVPRGEGRFDALVRLDPAVGLGRIAERPEALPDFAAGVAGWEAFRAAHGGGWRVYLDRRSGAPLLVEGRGISWVPAHGPKPASAAGLEAIAREFVRANETLFRIREAELVLDADGSGELGPDKWLLTFRRAIDGVPVEDERLRLYVVRGNLVAFGTDRWGATGAVPEAGIAIEAARQALYGYIGLLPSETATDLEPPRLALTAVPPAGTAAGDRRFGGAVGEGIAFRLVWRFAVEVAGSPGIWIAKVDAETGEVVAFFDDVKYERVSGGVYPVSNDGQCPDGCEQAGAPMPYADVSEDGSGSTANDMGLYTCASGTATATTRLNGPYVRVADNCGAVDESGTCEDGIDLGTSAGTDCAVPAGASPGNTHSARSCFYHLNRIKEKGRYWLPERTWLSQSLTANVNINNTCNAFWDGTVNFYRSGGGCRNTGEIAGVFNHEYGHGLDQNDGGGYDNPSEAYADVTSILEERNSCVGRGFYMSGTCSGYGDTCLTCTGIRDMDWDARQSHTPATPANFVQNNCGGGGGACGREVHCESYPPSEAIYDLATRDLPASGLDAASAWQLAERLWYRSRLGSGGDIYNCSLPASDSCGAGTWYTQMRIEDDDDGNLDNGTPHAAAIFAAFDRHALACGSASDPANQDTSSCPSLATPALAATAGSNSASLSWSAVAGANDYLVQRNDISCDAFTFNVVDTIPAPTTSYVDDGLPNGRAVYYRLQARGANDACESAVSSCVEVTPQPFAGTIKLDRPTYGCGVTMVITVRDANIGSSTTQATVFSTTEPAPETVTLTETEPGSARFEGTLVTSSDPATAGDGVLSITSGDLITAHYVDADDGQGGTGLTREATASADCAGPSISNVAQSGVTDVSATVTWSTDEDATSIVHWGEATPPAESTSTAGFTTNHAVTLTGLRECTVYYYSAESTDPPGNLALDDAGGQYYHFETLGDFGQGLQPCHQGVVTLDAPVVSCMAALPVRLVDLDLNADIFAADTVDVLVTSTTETTPEIVTLVETGPNTSTFTGSIPTAPGTAVAGDGVLQASDGDLVTATYHDADDGTGNPATTFDTGRADCAGSGFGAIRVTSISDDSATITWTTAEPTAGHVEWGTTPALGSVSATTALGTSHSASIGSFPECGRVYFRVVATDRYGNVATADAAGQPFEFDAYTIPGAVFRDGFESSTGWTLEGEWEIGAPQGLGSDPGDPTAAFAGTTVLGQDLSGQGSYPGDYEPHTTQSATSPVIDASGLQHGELEFRQWLNTSTGGVAYVEVKQGSSWISIWNSNNITGETASSWSLRSFDISQYADGNGSLQIRFRQFAGLTDAQHDAGFNVDRFLVRDGSLPDFDVCGACGGAPTFAGATSAADDDPCAPSGVTVLWSEAPAWGTGHPGTYAVYRSTDPGFVPGPGNLVAGGIAGTSWTDPAAPDDTDVYYVVRAENDETCSSGPNNGGVLDPNLVRVTARDATSQVLPGGLGGSLAAGGVNDAHVRLTWAAVPGAADYHVYRATSPQGPFTRVAETAATFWEDRDQFDDPLSRYYVVRAADACGNEGP